MFKKYIFIILLSLICSSVLFSQTNNKVSESNSSDMMSPPDMDWNYDQLLTEWKNGLKYAGDCGCEEGKPISFPDSVYIRRLHALPTRMELVFNPVVRNYIEMYAGSRRQQVSSMLGDGNYFFPMFEDILDREGMPLELKYLPVIESGLNPIARSRVGATGLWQFMAGTGRMYKLEINSLVDERRDPVKATEAAAKYLKDMYDIYGDWNLVIAAYNCGPGNVNKAIRRSGGQKDYWAIYPYLPRETRGYVPAFIAATYIMNYYEEHNICPTEGSRPLALDTLSIDKNIHFQQIASVLDLDINDIRKYNPQFSHDVIPGEYKNYAFNLPYNVIGEFISNEDSIIAYRNKELLSHRKVAGVGTKNGGVASQSMVHRIKSGDTLSGIAQKYGVTIKQLRSWNNMKSDRLTIGRRLSIYKHIQAPAVQLSTVAKKETDTLVVESKPKLIEPELKEITLNTDYIICMFEDCMSKIKRDPNSFPLLSLDGKKSHKSHTAKDDSKIIYHKVRTGETISQIALRYSVSEKEIVGWNKLTSTSAEFGQRLLIHLPKKSNESQSPHLVSEGVKQQSDYRF